MGGFWLADGKITVDPTCKRGSGNYIICFSAW